MKPLTFVIALAPARRAWLSFTLGAAVIFSSAGAAETPKPLRIALYDDAGSTGKGVPKVKEHFGKVPSMKLTVVKGEDIRAGVLKDYDVVIFTGGSGSGQAKGIGEEGRKEVKEFVERGGGYLGICAGAYLACEGFSWGVKVLDAKTASSKWMRGRGDVQMELTDEGKRIFGDRHAGQFTVLYANGPVLKPSTNASIPDFRPLALFRTEKAENNTPKGLMVNSPAAAAGEFGKGRVLVFSPHPEQTDGLEDLVIRAVEWIGRRRN
ncbi:MAG: biofilm PGA synthesis protein PgaB [Verrucomicrobia bacterium]|nr:biofilm PGA synthesis protein PgaB [Verrucomicrobiota bacterium]